MRAHPFQEGEPGISNRCMEEESDDRKTRSAHCIMWFASQKLGYAVPNHESNG